MLKQLRLVASLFAVLALVTFTLLVVNQTAQFVNLVSAVDPTLGQSVLIGLIVVYVAVIAVPLIIFIRLPRVLRPPKGENSPEFPEYLRQLSSRLASNSIVKNSGICPGDRSGIDRALKLLDAKANEVLRDTARTVFVTTAISQSGRLDALMVLLAQSRMVWQVAHVYNQRSSLRELINLYANVAVTTLAAVQIEELNLDEQVEPVVATVLGSSLASAIPGVGVVATMITNAVVDGSANAFLTLRVGAITKQYCGSLKSLDRVSVRRSASREAAAMLGSIVLESAGLVSKAILDATTKTVGSGVLSPLAQAAKDRMSALQSTVSVAVEKVSQGVSWRPWANR